MTLVMAVLAAGTAQQHYYRVAGLNCIIVGLNRLYSSLTWLCWCFLGTLGMSVALLIIFIEPSLQHDAGSKLDHQ